MNPFKVVGWLIIVQMELKERGFKNYMNDWHLLIMVVAINGSDFTSINLYFF